MAFQDNVSFVPRILVSVSWIEEVEVEDWLGEVLLQSLQDILFGQEDALVVTGLKAVVSEAFELVHEVVDVVIDSVERRELRLHVFF